MRVICIGESHILYNFPFLRGTRERWRNYSMRSASPKIFISTHLVSKSHGEFSTSFRCKSISQGYSMLKIKQLGGRGRLFVSSLSIVGFKHDCFISIIISWLDQSLHWVSVRIKNSSFNFLVWQLLQCFNSIHFLHFI